MKIVKAISYIIILVLFSACFGEDKKQNETMKQIGVYNQTGEQWEKKAQYDRAIGFYKKALILEIELLGSKDVAVGKNYSMQGLVWIKKGDYDRAEELFRKALKIKIDALGKNDNSVAIGYNNLALALHHKGKYAEALEFYFKALNIYKNTGKEKQLCTVSTYNNIAQSYQHQGIYEKSIDFNNKSLKILIDEIGENSQKTATAYNNLALTLYLKKEYEKSLKMYSKALHISVKNLGEEHPTIATIYNNMGHVWKTKGDKKKAIKLYTLSIEMMSKFVNASHPHLLAFKRSLRELTIKRAWDEDVLVLEEKLSKNSQLKMIIQSDIRDTLDTLIETFKPKMPRMIDGGTRQESMSRDNLTLTYKYTILKKTSIKPDTTKFKLGLRQQICNRDFFVYLLKKEAVLKHVYRYADGDSFATIEVKTCE